MMLIATTAEFMSHITGMVLNNADSLGNAEVLEHASEVDGVMVTMDAMEPSSQCNHQVCYQMTED